MSRNQIIVTVNVGQKNAMQHKVGVRNFEARSMIASRRIYKHGPLQINLRPGSY